MKQIVFGTFCFLMLAPFLVFGQSRVPTPVVDSEIRDRSSLKLRSIELERVKREAEKLVLNEPGVERDFRFGLVKSDFEEIQKLQNLIVIAYTTGKEINYSKISDLAAEIKERSVRLDKNLFAGGSIADENEKKAENRNQTSFKNAIIDLDNAIGSFVTSPMFQNVKLVDAKTSESAQLELAKILFLSQLIAKNAASMP